MHSDVVNTLTALPDNEKRAAIQFLGNNLPPEDQADATVNLFSNASQSYKGISIRKMSATLDSTEKLSLAADITRGLSRKEQESIARLINPSRRINDYLWVTMITAFVVILLFATYQAIMHEDRGVALTVAVSMSTFLMGLIVPNPGFRNN